jgi:hypothetical protein
MSSLLSAIVVLAAAVLAYQNARARGLWSWPAFFWTLPLVLVYCAWCAGAVLFFMATGASPALATGLILVAIFVGVVPLAIVAKRIYRHYVKGAR